MIQPNPLPAPRLAGFPPLVGAAPRVLVLGSMPGVRSLAERAYYAHPRNAFWPIMDELFRAGPSLPYAERVRRLTAAGLAVWDVLAHCQRPGSLDRAIAADTAVANDFVGFFADQPQIHTIFFNGSEAERLFRRRVTPTLSLELVSRLRFVRLPSTSPAHASLAPTAKLAAWQAVRHALEPAEGALR